MHVLVCQLDGKMPNLALARIIGHHRSVGDTVELRQVRTAAAVERGLFDARPHRVYASAIFDRSAIVARRLLSIYPDAIVGGTGWNMRLTLGDVGIDERTPPDYSDWPAFTASIGFTQRGCRLKCGFCVVPRKEGAVREEATAAEIWRGPPWPRNLILLDNDFFGQSRWRERIEEFRSGGYRVNFSQGINARAIGPEEAEAIASVDYFDTDFRVRRLYTAWDSRKDEDRLFTGLGHLVAAGVPAGRIMVYMLIGYWPGETEEDWLYRVRRLRDFGADPYPMPFVRNSLTTGFQRWVCGHYDRRVPWPDWKAARHEPRRLRAKQQLSLPLFSWEEGHHAEAPTSPTAPDQRAAGPGGVLLPPGLP